MDSSPSTLSSQGEASATNPFEEGRGEAWTDDVSKFAPWQLKLFREQQKKALEDFQKQQLNAS